MHKSLVSMTLRAKPGVIDLNLLRSSRRVLSGFGEDFAHEFGKNYLLAADGFCAPPRVSPLREALPREPQSQPFFLLGPVSVHGFRAADLSQKSARYRDLPAGAGDQGVPPG